MFRTAAPFAIMGALALTGCVVPPPAGPSVVGLPGQGKTLAQFQTDDVNCRQYAASRIDYAGAAAAGNSAVGSAAVGTVVGAAAGAAIGAAAGNPGLGAAVGGGTGLAVGAGAGSANAAFAGGDLQQAYDISYTQCLYGNGEQVVSQPPGYATYAAAYPYYGYPYYGYGYPFYGPGFYGPALEFRFGGGYGGYGGYGFRGGGYRGGFRR